MLTLTARQLRLIEGAPLHAVYLHVLTTYTNQDAKVVDTVRYFADRAVSYDYGNTGAQREFLPYVLSTSREHVEQMPHLPSGGSIEGELLRDYTITLRNVTPQGQTSLLADLRGELFEFSTLEVSELFLDPAAFSEDPEGLVGDEHVVIFRGELDGQPREIDEQSLTLRFVTETLEGLLPEPVIGSMVALRDSGKRLPRVYGSVQRVPLLGVQVGATTTLAQPVVLGTLASIALSDGSDFPAAGVAFVGGERIEFNGRTGDLLIAITRDPTLETEHVLGELVVVVPAEGIVYALGPAMSISALVDLWMRSPETGELFKLNDIGTLVPNDTVTLPSIPITSLQWSPTAWSELLQQIVANARITQQPQIADGAITTTTAAEDFDTDKRVIKSGEEDWTSPGRADGLWNTTTRTFTYDRQRSDRKLATNVNLPLPVTDRDPERSRLSISFTVTAETSIERVDVRVQVFPKLVQTSPMWVGLPSIKETIVGAVGNHTFKGAWGANPDRAVGGANSTTDELIDHELHVFFRVHESSGVGVPFIMTVQITALEVEYDYISSGSLFPLEAPVVVAGFSGGAGIQLYADVEGPVVPGVNFVLGYDFPAGETWDTNDLTDSDVSGGVRLLSDATLVLVDDFISDTANWTDNRQYATDSDATADRPAGMSLNCIRLTMDTQEAVDRFETSRYVAGANITLSDGPNAMSAIIADGIGTANFENTNLLGFGDLTDSFLFFPLFSVIDPGGSDDAIEAIDIRVGSGSADYWLFRVPFVVGGAPEQAVVSIQMNNPPGDSLWIGTTGTPDVTAIDRLHFILQRFGGRTSGAAEVLLTGTSLNLGPSELIPVGKVWAQARFTRAFSPVLDWSTINEFRFLIGRNPKAGLLLVYIFRFADSGSGTLTYRIPAVEIPEDVGTEFIFNFSDHAADPHFGIFNGLDKTDIEELGVWLTLGVQDLPLTNPVPVNPIVHLENLKIGNTAGTNLNAQVAPAATTDLDATASEYELDFKVINPDAVGEVVIQFSNESPTYPAGPVAYREIRFSPGDYPDGVTQTAIPFVATTVGAPTSLDDINVIRIELNNEMGSGFEIELYALRINDSASPYVDAEGVLITHPSDVMRHILERVLGVSASDVGASFVTAGTNLGSNEVSTVVNELGGDFYAIAGRLGFEQRFQLISEETATGTEYRLLTAKTDYKFPTNSDAEIDRWERISEVGRGRLDFRTRFRTIYDPDRGLEVPGVTAGYRQTLRVDVDVNDISAKVATALLTTAELNYGIRTHPLVALNSVVQAATAIDRESYFVTELIRSAGRTYVLEGVPALQAYTKERGDIIRLTPPWLGSTVHARVIRKTRTTGAGALKFDLVAVQVEVS